MEEKLGLYGRAIAVSKIPFPWGELCNIDIIENEDGDHLLYHKGENCYYLVTSDVDKFLSEEKIHQAWKRR